MSPAGTAARRAVRARGQRPHLRHDPARRRAGARRRADRGREARGRPPARPAQGRRHRGRLPGRLARRLRGGPADRPGDAAAGSPSRRSPAARTATRSGPSRRSRSPSGRISTSSSRPATSTSSTSCGSTARPRSPRPSAGSATAASSSAATPRSSSPPRTPRGPTSTTCSRSTRRSSRPAPRRSTSRTPSATRSRPSSAALVERVVALVGDQATVSVHCHNDLGLATANTLAAVQAGARQVEVTINGLGERAGNASLEEVVMALRTRPTQFAGARLAVSRRSSSTAASRLVSYLTGFAIQPNKAIVGGNAFAHESGIHQDGVIKNPLTYEIMTPQSVGLTGSQLTIGKLSGRRGLQGKLRELGYEFEGEALDEVYRQAIALADAKKEVTDADLLALVEQRAVGGPGLGRARRLERHLVARRQRDGLGDARRSPARSGPRRRPATARSTRSSARWTRRSSRVLGWHPTLTEYEIKAVSAGEDAQGQVLVRCRRSSDEGPGRAGRDRPRLIDEHHRGVARGVSRRRSNKLHGAEINGVSRGVRRRRRQARGARRDAPLPGRHDPGRRGRAGGRRRRAARRRRRRRAGSASRSTGPSSSSAARRSTRTASRSATEDVEALRRGRRGPARRGRRPEVVRPERAGPARSRRCSRCAAGSACSPTCDRSRVHPTLIASSPLRPELLAGVDMLIVRELTGGHLLRRARRRPPARARRPDRAATRCRTPSTRSERIVRLAFELARSRRGDVTTVDKANVLATSRLWRDGRRRGRRRSTRTSRSTTSSSIRARCCSSGGRPTSTSSSPRTCSATSCRTRRRSWPGASACCRRRRSASAGPRTGTFGLYEPIHGSAPDIAGQRPRQPDRDDPVGGDAAAAVARPARTRPRRSRRPSAAALDDGCRTADLAADGRRPSRGRHAGMVGAIGERIALREAARSIDGAPDQRGDRRTDGPRRDRRSPGHPLRHDPPRRHPGREHHAVARRQAARRADARRVRDALHRGRLAGLQPQGHRVLRGGPDDALGDARSWRPSGRPATASNTARRRPEPARAGRRRDAGRDDLRQELAAPRHRGPGRDAGREPRHDRGLGRLRRRSRARGGLRRRALLRRLQGRPRLRARRRCGPPARPARGRSSCATRTAAR